MYKFSSKSKILLLVVTIIISTMQVSLAQAQFSITGKGAGINITRAIVQINKAPAFTAMNRNKGTYEIKLPKRIYYPFRRFRNLYLSPPDEH